MFKKRFHGEREIRTHDQRPTSPVVKALVGWATGKRLTNRLPKLSLTTIARLALHKAAEQVRADQSATTQAGRRSWRGESREPACRRPFVQVAVFSKRTKKSKSARPTKIYKHSQSSFSWCDARKICRYFQSQ